MADAKITALTELTTPDSSDPVAIVDDPSGTPVTKKITVSSLINGGWIAYSGVTPTRASADDPTYVLTFAGVDLTGLISVGMKIKWTQDSTVRYGIVTAISFSTNTTLTLYGGTSYNVEDTGSYAISAFNFSPMRSPLGFPLSPDLWTVETSDSSSRATSTPTINVWTNPGSISIDIPIGRWQVSYNGILNMYDASDELGASVFGTLSTANNSESDAAFTSGSYLSYPATGYAAIPIFRTKVLTIAAKTTYYMNIRTKTSGLDSISFANNQMALYIRAVCAYL